MFHPLDHPMERGWVGRIDGDRVVQLAAQTLQSFFTGGGSAREHAVFPLDGVRLLAPVLHPPSVRIFEDATTFAFANPAAIHRPGQRDRPSHGGRLAPARGSPAARGGRRSRRVRSPGSRCSPSGAAPAVQPPKDRDFALGLGPVVVTPDELDRARSESSCAWTAPSGSAAASTTSTGLRPATSPRTGHALVPGDVLAGPVLGAVSGVEPDAVVEIEVDGHRRRSPRPCARGRAR